MSLAHAQDVAGMSQGGTVPGATLTPIQREAARLISMGMSHSATAKRVGRSRRQVIRWSNDVDFYAYVESLRRTAWQRIEVELGLTVVLAIDVLRGVLNGSTPSDEGRVELAKRLLFWYVDHVFFPTCMECGRKYRSGGFASEEAADGVWGKAS